MVTLDRPAKIHRTVSRMARSAVHDEALTIGVRAEAALASHRESGDHRVTVTEGRTDAFVNLEGTAAMSVEFGHWSGYRNRTWVPGLRVLRNAAGL